MSKKCSYCGAELMDDAAFCPYCAKSQIVKTAVKAPVLWRKKAAVAVMAAVCVFLVALIPKFLTVMEKQEMVHTPQSSSVEVSSQSSEAEINNVLANGVCGLNLTWKLDHEGTLTISGEGEIEHYTVDNYENRPWQEYHQQIKKIVIEEGATTIGGYTFYDCKYLTSVTIPESVTEIGLAAFRDCSSLTDVILPKNLSSTAGGIFSGCTSLTSVNIPQGVTAIWGSMFKDCSSLTSITIPKSVKSIENYAFYDCISLKEIIFEGSILKISDSAFSKVTAAVYYPADDPDWTTDKLQNYGGTLSWYHTAGEHNTNGEPLTMQRTSIDSEPINGCDLTWTLTEDGTLTVSGEGIMSDPDEKWPWENNLLQIKKVVIEEGVTEIGRYAFAGCKSLVSVTIPESVTRIRGFAFEGCESLISAKLPKSLTYFGGYVFKDCGALTGAVIPKGIEVISAGVFRGCSSLTDITIPKSVTGIPKEMFSGCSSLETIVFEGSIPEIADNAFYGVTAKVFYPANDASWTVEMRGNYGGALTWQPCE